MERHDWFGWERVEAPRATREQLSRVHPPAHVDLIEALSRARRRARSTWTRRAVAGT